MAATVTGWLFSLDLGSDTISKSFPALRLRHIASSASVACSVEWAQRQDLIGLLEGKSELRSRRRLAQGLEHNNTWQLLWPLYYLMLDASFHSWHISICCSAGKTLQGGLNRVAFPGTSSHLESLLPGIPTCQILGVLCSDGAGAALKCARLLLGTVKLARDGKGIVPSVSGTVSFDVGAR